MLLLYVHLGYVVGRRDKKNLILTKIPSKRSRGVFYTLGLGCNRIYYDDEDLLNVIESPGGEFKKPRGTLSVPRLLDSVVRARVSKKKNHFYVFRKISSLSSSFLLKKRCNYTLTGFQKDTRF